MSQQAMADRLGVSLRSQQNYEAGIRTPDATYLTALAASGADVLYVLTGQRSVTAMSAAQPLARDEEILLDNYRNLPADAKAAIKATSDAFARTARGAKRDKAA